MNRIKKYENYNSKSVIDISCSGWEDEYLKDERHKVNVEIQFGKEESIHNKYVNFYLDGGEIIDTNISNIKDYLPTNICFILFGCSCVENQMEMKIEISDGTEIYNDHFNNSSEEIMLISKYLYDILI